MTKARIREIYALAKSLDQNPSDNLGNEADALRECLTEIEHFQAILRRGDDPTKDNLPPAGDLPITVPKTPPKKARGTLEEFQAFAKSIGLPESDGEFCYWKLEGNGWKNGRSEVKDWRAVVRTWKTAKWLPSQKTEAANRSSTAPARCIL